MTNLITKTHNLINFTRIDLRGAGEINLTQGKGFQFEIIAEEPIHEILIAEIEDETLILSFEKHKKSIRTNKNIVYNITMPVIGAVRISGGGTLNCESIAGKSFALELPGGATVDIGSIAVVDYKLRVPGSAKITTKSIQAASISMEMPGSVNMSVDKLDADNLAIKMQGAGNLTVAGRVISQRIDISGVGNIKAGQLQSNIANIYNTGAGNITLSVTDDLEVVIKGLGNVKYYGNPRVKKSVKGFGNVKRIGDAPLVRV